MPRRRNAGYDDDDLDDGYDDYYDDYDDYEEDDYSGHAETEGGNAAAENAQDHLEYLVEEFRTVLGRNVAREQVDAVLVAANYDPSHALELLQSQIDQETRATTSTLESSRPSAVARMVDINDGVDDPAPPELPNPAPVEASATTAGTPAQQPFQFDKPSPDDLINQRRSMGRARAQRVMNMSSAAPGTALGLSEPPVSSTSAKQQPSGKTKQLQRQSDSALSESTPVDVGAPAEPRTEPTTRKGASAKDKKQQPKRPPKQRTRKVPLQSAEALASASASVTVVVAGHVDAGKSTLVGRLLRQVGAVSVDRKRTASGKAAGRKQSSATATDRDREELAWTTDQDRVEQEHGVTIDIATRVFKSQTSGTTFCVIDAPGHRDYIPAMILGACQASAALLIVDAGHGEFEAGCSENGQTREHAVLLRSLGVTSLIVVVNKMDVVEYDAERFNEVRAGISEVLKSSGWKVGKDVSFVPASGLDGTNVGARPSSEHPISRWEATRTVLDALEALPVTDGKAIDDLMQRPTRLVVSDTFRSSSLGGDLAVCGRLISGTIATKDQLMVRPGSEMVSVKAIEVGTTLRQGDNAVAVAGADNVPISIGVISTVDSVSISPGHVLCDPAEPVHVCTRFRARVRVLNLTSPLVKGAALELHLGGTCQPAKLSALVEASTRSAGTAARRRPRLLRSNESAVVDVSVESEVCVDVSDSVKFLSRFALRRKGCTVAAGLVTEILQLVEPVSA